LRADNALINYKTYTLFFTGQTVAAFEEIEVALANNTGQLDVVNRGRLLALRAWSSILQSEVISGELAQTALDLIAPDDSFSRIIALLPLGHTQRINGDLEGSTQTFREAYQLALALDSPLGILAALFNLALNLDEQGKRRESLTLCENALLHFVDSRGIPLPLAGIVCVPLATLYYAANDLTLAHKYALKGQELSRQAISDMILGGGADYALAQVHFARGETEEAIALIRTARETARQSSVMRLAATMWSIEADFGLRVGDIATAAHWAESMGLSPDDTVIEASNTYRLIYTRLLMAQGAWRDAQKVVDHFEDYALKQGRLVWLIQVHILQAIIVRQFGDEPKATRLLEQAVRLASPENYCRVFLDHAQVLADLLPSVRRVAPAFVDQLIADFGVSAQVPNPNSKIQNLLEPLSERETEILKLIAEGRSNQEIAKKLVITVGTTKWHLNHIYAKLSVKNRTEALIRARELNLI
jgi:LuxR family maltose regulon positive regulatory protein